VEPEIDNQHTPILCLGNNAQSEKINSFAPVKEEPIIVTAHEIEVLQIDQIKFIDAIGDYPESLNLHPVACRTEFGEFCVDDACKIFKTKDLGLTEIKSEVFTLSRHSDLDLNIRKATRRIMPTPGRAPFYQIAVNVRKCFELLIATSESLVIFGQGGDRISDKFIGDRQNDGRLILQLRCGRSRDSVNSYLSATEYIISEVQEYLYQEEATKSFCDLIRKEKSHLVNTLQSQRLAKDVISAQVSSAVRGWFTQYKTTGTITTFTSNIVPATKATVATNAAAVPLVTMNAAVTSRQLKQTGTPPSTQPPQSNIGVLNPLVADVAVIALADDLNKIANDLIALTETMKGVTDAGLKAAFYFDFMASKYSTEDIFNRISKYFNFDENPDENNLAVH